jgi:serine/threonine-protein kinase RsbW
MKRDESRLVLPRRPDSLRPLMAFAREKATQAGFPARGVKEVELAVEEMATDALEHAPAPGMDGPYEVTLERRPGQFVIAVEDLCAPFDLESARRRREAGLGLLLVGAFADCVRFENLGPRGRRVEIVKNIPSEDLGSVLAEGGSAAGSPEASAAVEIRRGRAEDCAAISRLCYQVAGRADGREFLYFPERLREMIASGALETRVAARPPGGIAGVCAASLDDPETPVAVAGPCLELFGPGEAGLRDELVSALLDGLKKLGVYGLLCECPEFGPQDAFAASGATETALLLDHWAPAPVPGKGRRKRAGQRRTVLVEFVSLGEGPAREVFAPYHHAGVIRTIFSQTGLKRLMREVEPRKGQADLPVASRVDVEVRPSAGRARLAVKSYGRDLLDHIYLRLEDLERYGVELVHLDLPLSDPATASFALPAETLGFSFAGVVPELFGGDVLRLQRLKGRPLEPPAIPAATEFGAELARYVWGEFRNSTGAIPE